MSGEGPHSFQQQSRFFHHFDKSSNPSKSYPNNPANRKFLKESPILKNDKLVLGFVAYFRRVSTVGNRIFVKLLMIFSPESYQIKFLRKTRVLAATFNPLGLNSPPLGAIKWFLYF